MTNDRYTIRTMSATELDIAVDWAAKEGWNPGLADATCFRAQDPDGFLLGALDGEPIASISVVRYGASYGFLGFYICVPEARGKGYGLRLWEKASERLADRVVGLDGVVAQQQNYARSGYVLAHRNVRLGGRVDIPLVPGEEGLVDIATLPFERLTAYDRPFFAGPREAFLRCWLKADRRQGLALVRNGELAGYGVVRECREGSKIGPLFADDEAGADLLFRGLAAKAQGRNIYLDIPEPHAAAWALGRRYGLAPSFETARMYRGPAPELPLLRIYGITTFELG